MPSLTQKQWDRYAAQTESRRRVQLQACYEKGKAAQREGVAFLDNSEISHAWRSAWSQGWLKARADELSKTDPVSTG